jgi:hypothetical protein
MPVVKSRSRFLRSSRELAFPAFLSEARLLNRGECEIVAVAAGVVGLEGVSADGERGSVRQVAEGVRDRIVRSVVDHGEDRALRERLIAQSNKGEEGAAVDRHAFGCDLVGFGSVGVDLATVNAVGIKSEAALSR